MIETIMALIRVSLFHKLTVGLRPFTGFSLQLANFTLPMTSFTCSLYVKSAPMVIQGIFCLFTVSVRHLVRCRLSPLDDDCCAFLHVDCYFPLDTPVVQSTEGLQQKSGFTHSAAIAVSSQHTETDWCSPKEFLTSILYGVAPPESELLIWQISSFLISPISPSLLAITLSTH